MVSTHNLGVKRDERTSEKKEEIQKEGDSIYST